MNDRKLEVLTVHARPWINLEDKKLLDFSSNDYLNLRFNDTVKQAYVEGIHQYGVGSGGSPLVCGYDLLKNKFEKAFSTFVGFEQSLFVNSGYTANLSVLSVLFEEEEVDFFLDKYCHASIYDALKLRNKKYQLYRYPHQNLSILERQLLKSKATNKVIVSEGVFSMTGLQTSLPALVELKANYNATLIIDDAHCIGVKGQGGRGSTSYVNRGDIDVLICPLGKAFAMQGAMISASKKIIHTLVQKSRPYIYSTASSSALVNALFKVLELIQDSELERFKLERNIQFFNQLKRESDYTFTESESAIQFLIGGDITFSKRLFKHLIKYAIYCYPVYEPTVPPNKSGFRMVLSSAHELSHIATLFSALGTFNHEIKP